MRRASSTRESAFAASVLPTPASPSRRSGFSSASERKRAVASPRSGRYCTSLSATSTSLMLEKVIRKLYVGDRSHRPCEDRTMEYRQLGRSGLRVSELTLGTMTFGTAGASERMLGSTTTGEARRQVDLAL